MNTAKFVEVKSANVNGIFQVIANKGITWLVQDDNGDQFQVQKRLVVRGPWEEEELTPEEEAQELTKNHAPTLAAARAQVTQDNPKAKPKAEKPAPAERDPDLVTLKELCFEIGVIPRIARRRLRKAVGHVGIGGRWEWKKGSPEYAKVLETLTTAPATTDDAAAE